MADGLSLELDTSDIEELARKFPKFEQIIFREMDAAMRGSLEVFKAEVVGRTPVNLGLLRQSIQAVTRGQPPHFEGEVSTPLVYGEPVERGRKPGRMPPVDNIEMWVQRKLGQTGSEARSTAFLIARAIGRRGTKGAFMFRDGFEAGRPAVEKLWRNVASRAADKIEAAI